jgi:hypothetical protein
VRPKRGLEIKKSGGKRAGPLGILEYTGGAMEELIIFAVETEMDADELLCFAGMIGRYGARYMLDRLRSGGLALDLEIARRF